MYPSYESVHKKKKTTTKQNDGKSSDVGRPTENAMEINERLNAVRAKATQRSSKPTTCTTNIIQIHTFARFLLSSSHGHMERKGGEPTKTKEQVEQNKLPE